VSKSYLPRAHTASARINRILSTNEINRMNHHWFVLKRASRGQLARFPPSSA